MENVVRSIRWQCAWTLLVALVLFSLPVEAQDAFGKIAGNITDATGALIPGATVVVTNLDTKISKQTVADKQGFYQVPQLPIGKYEVSALAPGFGQSIVRPATALEINQTLRVDITLQVGATKDVVTVESQAHNVETENTTVGGTVTGEAIFELPLNGRNTLDLLATQPGVSPSNPDSGAMGNYSIGGQRTDSVTYLLDGGLNNDLLSNGVIVNPNPDAIAEFRVLESTYGAEYGRNAGGIVSVVSKSGTNQLHGTAYDYVRNTDFDANDFFLNEQGQPRGVLNRNQYGLTIGGPIVIPHIVNGRNKLFFFFSYQGQRQTQLQLDGVVANLHAPRGRRQFLASRQQRRSRSERSEILVGESLLSREPNFGQPGNHRPLQNRSGREGLLCEWTDPHFTQRLSLPVGFSARQYERVSR